MDLDVGGKDKEGRKVAVSAVEHALELAAQGRVSPKVWGLPRAALLNYHPEIDLNLDREGQVLGLLEIRAAAAGEEKGGKRKGPLLGVYEAVWSPETLPPGALDVARTVGKEVGRHLAAAILQLQQQQKKNGQAAVSLQLPSMPQADGLVVGTALVKNLLPVLLKVPMQHTRIQDLMRTVTSEVERFLLSSPSSSSSSSSRRVYVDLFAQDQEGLWTVAQDGRGFLPSSFSYDRHQQRQQEDVILTLPSSARDGVLAHAVRNVRKQKQQQQVVEGDLVGVPPVDIETTRVTVSAFPIITLLQPGSDTYKIRGLLRCVVTAPLTSSDTSSSSSSSSRRGSRSNSRSNGSSYSSSSNLLTREEGGVLEAVAHVIGGSITILDSVVATNALQELYQRADTALAQAQYNVQVSQERSNQVQALCTRALAAARPLWWESTSSLPSPAQLVTGQAFCGQVARVAQAALQQCQRLFSTTCDGGGGGENENGGCWKAMLVLTKEGGARAGVSHRLDVYEWVEGAQPSVRRHEVIRPTGHGVEGGLLGRCLWKAEMMNVVEPTREERYNTQVDGEEGGATLLVPLCCWPAGKQDGAVVMGVMRVWRRDGVGKSSPSSSSSSSSSRQAHNTKKHKSKKLETAATAGKGSLFTHDDEILAEVFAGQLSMALSYAKALDIRSKHLVVEEEGEGNRGTKRSSAYTPQLASPSLLSIASSLTPGRTRARTTPSAAAAVAEAAAALPLKSSIGRAKTGRKEWSFFQEEEGGAEGEEKGDRHGLNRSQLHEIKKQLQDIHISTRQTLSCMEGGSSSTAAAAAARAGAGAGATIAAASMLLPSPVSPSIGMLDSSSLNHSDILSSGLQSIHRGLSARNRKHGGRASAMEAMNRSAEQLEKATLLSSSSISSTSSTSSSDRMITGASNFPSLRPPALSSTREEHTGGGTGGAGMTETEAAAAVAVAAATAALSPVDLAQKIERMKEQNHELSKNLRTFLGESSMLST